MNDKDTSRLSRLVAILTQHQTKRSLTEPELAAKFSVSSRTILPRHKSAVRSRRPVLTEDWQTDQRSQSRLFVARV